MRPDLRGGKARGCLFALVAVLLLTTSVCAAQAPAISDDPSGELESLPEAASASTPEEGETPETPASAALPLNPFFEKEVRDHLQDGRYRFCQDPNYRFFRAEKESLCSQVEAFEQNCPTLRNACQRPPWEEEFKTETDESSGWNLNGLGLDFVGVILKILFWLTMGLVVAYIARALIRRAQLWREELASETAPTPASPLKERQDNFPEELRTHVLLTLARASLDSGKITEALHLTYRATIRALADAEWVKPHRSKTSGDYLRSLRERGPLTPTRWDESDAPQGVPGAQSDLSLDRVTMHLRDLDRERFRGGPRPEKASSLLAQAEVLASRLSPLLIFLALLLSGCDRFNAPQSPHEPYGPRGNQLFEDLLRAQAPSLHRRLQRVLEVPEEASTVVAVGAKLRPLEWKTLNNWVSGGGHLVVAAPPSQFLDEFGQEFGTSPCEGTLTAPGIVPVKTDETRAFKSDTSGEILARCADKPFASTVEWNDGWVTVIADDHLFQNVSLAASHNASLVFHLLGNLDGHVEYLGPFTGRGSQNPLESITRAGFGWWVFQLLLLIVIYAWSRGKRLTSPVDPSGSTRRAFSEHARALSRMYERAGASGWALRHYSEWVYDTLRRRAPSTRSDMKSLTRAVSGSEQEANKLREALTIGRRADELGETEAQHHATFRRLKSAILGVSEVSHKKTSKKD